MSNELPNQTTTWANLTNHLETFEDWCERDTRKYQSESSKLLVYLSDQLKVEGQSLPTFNHPVLGMLSHMSEGATRLQELMLAYLTLAVTGDDRPALKLIWGQRLNPNLHPEYVEATQCYAGDDLGDEFYDSTAVLSAIEYALELGESDDGLLFLENWNGGEFDVLRKEWPDAPIEVYGAESKPMALPKGLSQALMGQSPARS
tara:strand:+ start:1862 stop:2470 length:609 start_codon:yes stop_codon:yes gene_type:complete